MAGPDQDHGRVELQTFQNLVVNQSRNHVLHYSIEFLFYNSFCNFASIIEGALSNVTFSYSFAMERITEPPVTMIRPTKKSLMPTRMPMAHTPDRGNCLQTMMRS